MTLILGMIKDEGIYLSVDYRVTNPRTSAVVDDASVKFLEVHYPPDKIGPRALVAYTGTAQLRDGTPVGDWMRETMRGETAETFDDSMNHLRERLDRDLAALRNPLIVNVVVLHDGRKYFGGLSNIKIDEQGDWVIRDSFAYAMNEITRPFVFGNGAGAARVQADHHLDLLRAQVGVRPRRLFDHMKLLASVNRRVAAAEGTVSPFCHVTFLNADDRYEPTSHVFLEQGEAVPFRMPMLSFGIDLSILFERFMQSFQATTADAAAFDFEPSEINEQLKRRP